MRTKTLICAAALAAGALTSWAQSNVYSLNVVGYVNMRLENTTANLIGNPLNNTAANGNNINNLFKFPVVTEGATIFRYDGATLVNDIDGVTFWTFNNSGGVTGWVNSATSDLLGFPLNPGEGISITPQPDAANGTSTTNTFVGDVMQGGLTNLTVQAASGRWYANMIPRTEAATNAVASPQFPLNSGDTLLFWDNVAGDYDANSLITHDSGLWSPVSASGVILGIGQAFQLNSGDDYGNRTWIRNFTVQ